MIPNAADTREAIGDYASIVSNRSLLFEKIVLPKSWGHQGEKFDDASRWNVLRASEKGTGFIRESLGRNATEHQREIAAAFADINIESDLALRAKSSLHFLSLIEKSYPGRSRTLVATLGGRLLINLAGGVQENAGISLDRCFGLPIIPGSAIKGVARHNALWEIHKTEDAEEKSRLLKLAMLTFGFGVEDLKNNSNHTNWRWAAGNAEILTETLDSLPSKTDLKGLVSFLPASPADDQIKIVAEGITPHTDSSGKEKNPNVLTFPAVERGSNFGFALILNRDHESAEDVLDHAARWVMQAITGTGIGAKTSAGFGWFVIDEAAEARIRDELKRKALRDAEAAEKRRKEKAEADKIADMPPLDRHIHEIALLDDNDFMAKAKNAVENRIEGDELIAFFRVLGMPEKKKRRRHWRNRKPELWAQLTATADTHGITLT